MTWKGRWLVLLAVGCHVGLCAAAETRTAATATRLRSVSIEGIPHVRQKPDFCGEACVAMYLRKLEWSIDQDAVFDHSGVDPALGRGCYTRDLNRAMQRLGLRPGDVWYRLAADEAADGVPKHFASLHADLLRGVPSIVCMHYDDRPDTTEHFRLVVGYDADTDEVIYHEPAIEQGAGRRMKRDAFLRRWPLKYQPTTWTLIRLKLETPAPAAARASRPAAADRNGLSNADYAQHIRKLKQKLPGDTFHVVLRRPFVVIGDEAPEQVQERSRRTIQWAVDRLKRDFFSKDPAHIIDIWLFKDKESYRQHTWELFRQRPTTPYGFYSPRHRALIMNISTGGGTLVHEIVHPFMSANFPKCPSWFNEGLASLYEQCGDRNGHIWGYTNWRLRGLQAAIEKDRVPSFKTLCGTTSRQFYDDDRGTNYAQARYLCLYLQHKGLLVKYYQQFRKAADQDPTGYETLEQILGEPDMQEFQQRWHKFVLELKF